jgi:hypothetical protein
MNQYFYFIFYKIFVLSLSYLRMLSDELFLKSELNKKFGLKTCKKGPGAPVIDISKIKIPCPSGLRLCLTRF